MSNTHEFSAGDSVTILRGAHAGTSGHVRQVWDGDAGQMLEIDPGEPHPIDGFPVARARDVRLDREAGVHLERMSEPTI